MRRGYKIYKKKTKEEEKNDKNIFKEKYCFLLLMFVYQSKFLQYNHKDFCFFVFFPFFIRAFTEETG